MEYVLFEDLPMPPTSNHQYISITRRGRTYRVASEELRTFKELMSMYPNIFPDFKVKFHIVQDWAARKRPLEIRCTFYFKRERLFTKDNRFKRLDVSNRLKASHDSLSEILEIDDSYFFKVVAIKAVTQGEESFSAEIRPIR